MDFGEVLIVWILVGLFVMFLVFVGFDSKLKIVGIFLGFLFFGVCVWFVWKIFVYLYFFFFFWDLFSLFGVLKWNGYYEVLFIG